MAKQSDNFDVRRVTINMLFNVISFVLNLGISFFITPYITKQFGSEAYGFVKLATDFSSYASILSIALNSMASRFIMLERVHKNEDNANQYYTSVTLANVILTAILAVPSLVIVVFLEKMLEIPATLVLEVKATFAVTFASFLINLVFSTASNCFYLVNRLDISSVRESLGSIIRIVCILALFTLTTPRISYVALGSLVATVFMCTFNIRYTKKLTPELSFRISYFNNEKLIEILSSGVWNSITKLSQIFSSGLDLLITNLLIGATDMGYLSVAKTVPNMIASFNATVANVFSPNLMMLYAQENMDQLKKTIKMSMRFMCLFVSVPCAVLIVMGVDFFELWVPGQPAEMINILSVLTIINSCVTGPMQPLYQVFTITNKIKQSSVVMIVYGFSSILITFICLKLTNLGVYAVAGVSLIGSLVVALCYHLPFSAVYLGLPWRTFFPEIGKSVLALISACLIGMSMKSFFMTDTWFRWFAVAILVAVLGVGVNFFVILNQKERQYLFDKVKRMLKGGR